MQSSGYKLNYTKSEILPLNIQDNNIKALTDPLKWCNNGFKYLGIQIGKSNGHIFKQNYIKLLEQTKLNHQRWMDLPLSLIGRINTIKMNILPKFRNYYLASQYRSIWIWLHAESSEVRWVPIEQHEMKYMPLKDVPFIGNV